MGMVHMHCFIEKHDFQTVKGPQYENFIVVEL